MKVYHVYDDGSEFADDDDFYGEIEGMFDESGNLLGAWSLNDAHWRGEYMNGFMKKLGIDVVKAPASRREEFLKKLREDMGC